MSVRLQLRSFLLGFLLCLFHDCGTSFSHGKSHGSGTA
jgi:hypothetical protein